MNYRHAFHAGNHADVFKHIVMTRLIALLSRKKSPFVYMDTHAGIGLYDLQADEATRTGEWLSGIKLLLEQEDYPAELSDYLQVINQLNADKQDFQYYPGSPMLAKCLMRKNDRLILNEKHPEDSRLLKRNMQHDPRIAIHSGDGWLLPKALLPVAENRALILIDAPFEQPNELQLCVSTLSEAISKMRQSVVAIWYPIKDRRLLSSFYQQMQQVDAPTLLRAELMINPADNSLGLNGSGMIIANPPWGLEEELTKLLTYLMKVFSATSGRWQLEWLIKEAVKNKLSI